MASENSSEAEFETLHGTVRPYLLFEPTAKPGAEWINLIYTVFQKSDAKIQITITTAYLIRIKYPLSRFNYHLSDVNIANFNKIHRTVSEQQLF